MDPRDSGGNDAGRSLVHLALPQETECKSLRRHGGVLPPGLRGHQVLSGLIAEKQTSDSSENSPHPNGVAMNLTILRVILVMALVCSAASAILFGVVNGRNKQEQILLTVGLGLAGASAGFIVAALIAIP